MAVTINVDKVKFRDQNGNYQSPVVLQGDTGIQGPKGDPGDDYTITAQDKSDIAGLVEADLAPVIANAENATDAANKAASSLFKNVTEVTDYDDAKTYKNGDYTVQDDEIMRYDTSGEIPFWVSADFDIGDIIAYQSALYFCRDIIDEEADTNGETLNPVVVSMDELYFPPYIFTPASIDEMVKSVAKEEVAPAIASANAAAQNANNATGYIATTEASSTASAAHAKGSYLIYDGKLYQATADIAIGDTLATTGTGANIAQAPGGAMGEVASLKSATAALEELAIINNSGIGIAGASNLVYSGFGPRALPVGKALTTDKETSISASVGNVGGISPGITAATVDEGIFVDKIGHSDAAAYSFVYEIDRWMFGGASVTLTDYGITVAGTAINGDEIVVHVAADTIPMNVMDHDYHTPVNANIPHTCTIAMRDCYENRQFDAPEGLIHVVNGLAAGEHFYLTLYKGQYGGGTAQDGVYGGTLAADQAIPAGGYLRHTTMGVYQSGGYTREQIANGKWIAYDANFVQIGAQIATDVDDTSGTDFGTATASTYQGNSEHVNFTERNAYGCNRVDQSAWLQYANADGVGWWQQKNEWDFPPANVATIKGLMTGLDPAMKAAMVPVRIRTALANCDGGGYVDIETKVFPLSMTEVGFGANNGQYETSWGLDNTLKTVPLAFWQGATNEDRIKTLNGAARTWFLRGAYPSYARGVRYVNTSGALNYYSASGANGLVAAWVIGNPVIQPA